MKTKLQQQRKIASELSLVKVRRIHAVAAPAAAAPSTFKRQRKVRALRAKDRLLRRGNRQDYEYSGSFQEAIAPALVLAQVFGLMPVRGVTSKSVQDLHFSWTNMRTIYSILVTFGFATYAGFSVAHACYVPFVFSVIDSLIFTGSTFVIAGALLALARQWPTLLEQWEQVEQRLPPLRTQLEKSMLAYRIKMITLVASMCSLIEHILSMLSLIYYVNACPAIPDSPYDSFFFTNAGQLFYFLEYSTPVGFLGKLINILSTFAWNFNDIFIMIVSVAITAKFHQLNEHMHRAIGLPTTEQFWIQSRENYRSLCRLCNAADEALSISTLLCFSNNLFFICAQIFKSLQKKPTLTHAVYFWFSLIYLLGRTFILSLYAASINDESKRPLLIFRLVKREFWCPELKRFSEEVNTDVVALSGMKFFELTRGLVLSVAGTIVTYELILLQFNKDDKVGDCFDT